MLTAKGNPSMNNLTHIINALRETLKVDYEIHAVPSYTLMPMQKRVL
jgi:hypothetical protein